mmetsp:Transcript_14522/g.25770  ORF Transcript_14522/g.25770 Transcript_14522/m.25770 type:complete len:95 (-) Transcript_14522:331-615(-)
MKLLGFSPPPCAAQLRFLSQQPANTNNSLHLFGVPAPQWAQLLRPTPPLASPPTHPHAPSPSLVVLLLNVNYVQLLGAGPNMLKADLPRPTHPK